MGFGFIAALGKGCIVVAGRAHSTSATDYPSHIERGRVFSIQEQHYRTTPRPCK